MARITITIIFAHVIESELIHIIIFFSYNIGVIYKSNTRRHVRENVRTGLSFVIKYRKNVRIIVKAKERKIYESTTFSTVSG